MSGHDEQRQRFVEGMRVLIVGGIAAGAVLVGLGSRLAMLLLRVTSPDRARGVKSDDGFIIGQVTLAGTYNLMLLGSVVGLIGAVAYKAVSTWLIGPRWFRRLTTGLASGAVGGAALIHADGIDFTLLQPTWLAIGLFIALPGMFGTLIGPVIDSVGQPNSWTRRGRRRWLLPLVSVGVFPLSIPFILMAALFFYTWVAATDIDLVKQVRDAPVYALSLRGLWLLVATLGLVALVHDVQALTG
jgi:hypothetical protein